ncbi:Uma2 family endonuclease [bacterium]|nr:MAG: Uma2 family endonuclease [bacterium]
MQAIAIAPNYATEEDLWDFSQDGYRYELIDGELKCMPPSGAEHGRLTADITIEVGAFVRRNNLGKCFGAETGFRISESPLTILAPDFAFVTSERMPVEIPTKFLAVVPDLVLEVRSPGDRAGEVADKVGRWLAAGTQIVWELNPRTKKLTIFRPNLPAVELGVTDMLDAEPLLPNWTLELSTIL